ncbi:hypothetical protein JOD67_004628 [Tenggerimyces flavus]|nr:hypothetical protein [Tenggerimyces flavus]
MITFMITGRVEVVWGALPQGLDDGALHPMHGGWLLSRLPVALVWGGGGWVGGTLVRNYGTRVPPTQTDWARFTVPLGRAGLLDEGALHPRGSRQNDAGVIEVAASLAGHPSTLTTARPSVCQSLARRPVGPPPPPLGRCPIGRPSTIRRQSPIGPAASHPSVGRRRWLDGSLSADCCCSWRVGSIVLCAAVLGWCCPWAVAAVECGGRSGARQGRRLDGRFAQEQTTSLRDRFATLDSPRTGHQFLTRRPLPRERVPGPGLLAVPVCCRVAVACWPRASCGSDEAGAVRSPVLNEGHLHSIGSNEGALHENCVRP